MVDDPEPALNADDTAPFLWHEAGMPHGYLSQWYKYPFHSPSEPEQRFSTAEHWMMCQKAILFSDHDTAAQVLAGQSMPPRKVKGLGRRAKGFDEKLWNQERVRIVEEGNWLKFASPVADVGVAAEGLAAKIGREGAL